MNIFESYFVGGSTSSSIAEAGGPGMVYFDGPIIKNLRVDNRCQQPKVNMGLMFLGLSQVKCTKCFYVYHF